MTSSATRRGATPRGGRPNKGKRQPLMSRVPQDLAVVVSEEAERLGMTLSDYIASVLAEKHDFNLPAVHFPVSDNSVQETLMQSAS